MRNESRVKKSLLNARVNLICYFVALVVTFYSRKVFFQFLGAEFLGLTGTITSFLEFFNLAESGVGMAVAFLLYKPIFEGDENKINELISVFGYIYRMIGLLILALGVGFSLFLPLVFPHTSFSWGLTYFAYYAALTGALLGYFVNYPQILLSADQRNYEVTGYYQAVTVAQIMAQVLLICWVHSFYVFVGLQLLFSFVYSAVLYWRIYKIYPWLRAEVGLGRRLFVKYNEIGRYVKQIVCHKIGGFAHYQLMPVLIYGYVSLPVVALYGNYTMIGMKLNAIVNSVLGSTSAGVGSLIAEGDKGKILEVYEKLFAIDMIAAGVIASCIYELSSAFISLWLGKEYVLGRCVVLLISIEFFLGILRLGTDQFIQGAGLFSDIWSPLVEVGLLVAVSLVGGSLWGLPGVLLGPIVSVILVIYLWKPYFLFSRGFKLSVWYYWWILLKNFSAFAVAWLVAMWSTRWMMGTASIDDGWLHWLAYSAVYGSLLLLMSFILISVVSPQFRKLWRKK